MCLVLEGVDANGDQLLLPDLLRRLQGLLVLGQGAAHRASLLLAKVEGQVLLALNGNW